MAMYSSVYEDKESVWAVLILSYR